MDWESGYGVAPGIPRAYCACACLCACVCVHRDSLCMCVCVTSAYTHGVVSE